jgi:hypothetical protein
LQAREPVDRPLDVIATEIALTVMQALLVGILLWLAQGYWEELGIATGPVLAVLVVLAAGVGAGWLLWLLGHPGWVMAAANLPVALLMGGVFLLGLQGLDTAGLGWLVTIPGLVFSIAGIAVGVFVPGPRRIRWQGLPPPRAGRVPPRLTPTTVKAIERTRAIGASVSLPRPGTKSATPTSTGLSVATSVPSIRIEPDRTGTGSTRPGVDDDTRETVSVGARSTLTLPDDLDEEDDTRPWPRPPRPL